MHYEDYNTKYKMILIIPFLMYSILNVIKTKKLIK